MRNFDPFDGPGMKAIRNMDRMIELAAGPRWVRDLQKRTALDSVSAAAVAGLNLDSMRSATSTIAGLGLVADRGDAISKAVAGLGLAADHGDAISKYARMGNPFLAEGLWSKVFAHETAMETVLGRSHWSAIFEANDRMAKLYEPLLAAGAMSKAIDAFGLVDDRFGIESVMRRAYGPTMSGSVFQSALAATINSASMLAAPWKQPIAILSTLHESEDLALTWTDAESPPTISAAALRHRSEAPSLEIAVKVACWLCKNALALSESEFSWEGETRGVLDVRVMPICGTCSSRSPETLEKLEKALNDFTRPSLRLISSEGETDGIARGGGKLRLVRENDENGDD